MELNIYALIYWNINFKGEVKKMLHKKLFSTSLVLSMLLVGCSSVQENEIKENKEKVEEVEVQEEQNVESNKVYLLYKSIQIQIIRYRNIVHQLKKIQMIHMFQK